MPIANDIKEYLAQMDTFIAHWTAVDAALGAVPLTLPDGVGLAGFMGAKATLTAAYLSVEEGDNRAQTSAADCLRLKSELLPRLAQFKATVGGLLPGSRYAGAVAKTPSVRVSQGVFVKAVQDTLTLWAQIEADSAVTLAKPLTLADGTTKASLEAGFLALQSAYASHATGKAAVAQARSERNTQLKVLDAQMKQYRKTAQARLPKGHPLLANLPSISR
ncbi:hypothetical protein [Armatimonas sp.]|uniref:hypothetical protein n=1 Tax=Armatimonas sp. TaxID=1872638 RepID=UPI00286C44F5|nr:hypothetical protein [Armatimonas sp.]